MVLSLTLKSLIHFEFVFVYSVRSWSNFIFFWHVSVQLSQHQMLWGCLFLGLVLWAGEPSVGLRPHTPWGEPLQLRYPSEISAAAHGSGVSPVPVSALPTRLQ